jgi:hypothetical protein
LASLAGSVTITGMAVDSVRLGASVVGVAAAVDSGTTADGATAFVESELPPPHATAVKLVTPSNTNARRTD